MVKKDKMDEAVEKKRKLFLVCPAVDPNDYSLAETARSTVAA